MSKFTEKTSFVDKQGKLNSFIAISESSQDKKTIAEYDPSTKEVK